MRSSEPRRKTNVSRSANTSVPPLLLLHAYDRNPDLSPRYKSTRVPSCQDSSDICVRRISTSAIMAQEPGRTIVLRYPATQADGPTKPQSWRRGSASLTRGRSCSRRANSAEEEKKLLKVPHHTPPLHRSTPEPSTSLDRVISTVP